MSDRSEKRRINHRTLKQARQPPTLRAPWKGQHQGLGGGSGCPDSTCAVERRTMISSLMTLSTNFKRVVNELGGAALTEYCRHKQRFGAIGV